jgi:hypothetical protein
MSLFGRRKSPEPQPQPQSEPEPQKPVQPFTDKGAGVFVITGGGAANSADSGNQSVNFGAHLAAFRKEHPELEIEKMIPRDEKNAHWYDMVVLTRPKGEGTN